MGRIPWGLARTAGQAEGFMQETGDSPLAVMLAEYQAAQDCYLHYDAFRWQAGSILIAGVFVFWGFLLSRIPPPSTRAFGVASLMVMALMTIWILFAQHC